MLVHHCDLVSFIEVLISPCFSCLCSHEDSLGCLPLHPCFGGGAVALSPHPFCLVFCSSSVEVSFNVFFLFSLEVFFLVLFTLSNSRFSPQRCHLHALVLLHSPFPLTMPSMLNSLSGPCLISTFSQSQRLPLST